MVEREGSWDGGGGRCCSPECSPLRRLSALSTTSSTSTHSSHTTHSHAPSLLNPPFRRRSNPPLPLWHPRRRNSYTISLKKRGGIGSKMAPLSPITPHAIGRGLDVHGGDEEVNWLLSRSLELIAGARDRLTFDGLLYALSLYTPPSTGGVSRSVKDIAELRDNLRREVGEGRIRQLLRPFADLGRTVGFVHQSLKEAVFEFSPLTDAAMSVGGGIESVMLRTCVDYLLLVDFDCTKTIPDDEWVNQEILQVLPPIGPPVSSNTDPFGAFFHYTAHWWTDHLDGAPVDFNLDDVLKLASPTSARYRPWVLESGRNPWRPSSSPEVNASPLCLLVGFGNVFMLEQQLDRLAQNGARLLRKCVKGGTCRRHSAQPY